MFLCHYLNFYPPLYGLFKQKMSVLGHYMMKKKDKPPVLFAKLLCNTWGCP